MNLEQVYKRIARWYSARFEQVFNHEKCMQELNEKHSNFLTAEVSADELESACELVFACFGQLWRLGVDPEQDADIAFQDADALVNAEVVEPKYLISSVLDCLSYSPEYPNTLAIHTVIVLVMHGMTMLKLDSENMLKALEIICETNDTLKVDGSQSQYYVSPSDKYTALLEKVNGKLN